MFVLLGCGCMAAIFILIAEKTLANKNPTSVD
jgi:hypothetical protein